ncbi:hypothetical protein [Effusibacillus consociatus]|uniref:DUF2642 domain-containing protein n=1 Tax=Effusibacillus consociatus TaxID=1117041 RepID=A0ABV9Q4L1_9BACL
MLIKDEVERWIKTNRLVRLEILKGRGVRQMILGRIIRYDEPENTLLIYHEDEKNVRNLRLNQIETIQAAD